MRNYSGKYWVRLVIGLLSVTGLLVVALLMARETLTQTESKLLNFLLFIFSVSASWIFSKLYSESSASENLRDYGVQVARGVMVLQSQIRGLTSWISTKRQELPANLMNSVTSAQFEHIEETLRGFESQSDATLRGIASVIGDAFKQYEETISQINELRQREAEERDKIIHQASQLKHQGDSGDDEREEMFQRQLLELEQRTSQRIAELAKRTSLPIDIQKPERNLNVRCPVCGVVNQTRIVVEPGSTRQVVCNACRSNYNVHVDSSGNAFVRIITRGLGAALGTKSVEFDYVTVVDDVAFSLSAIRKRVTPSDFIVLAKRLVALFDRQEIEMQALNIADINSELTEMNGPENTVAGKRIGEFLQMLFWGRFFRFDGAPGFSSTVVFASIRFIDVMKGFFRAAGHNFAKTGHEIDETRERNDIGKYGPDLNPDEISEVLLAFVQAYDERKMQDLAGIG